MKTIDLSLRKFLLSVLGFTALVVAGTAFAAPPEGILDQTHASVRAVIAVQDRVTPELMTVEGILGTAVGLDDNNHVALVVYVDRDGQAVSELVRSLPPTLFGATVKVELTDKFIALGKPSGSATRISHTAKQTPPIQLGTSGGWRHDLANGYCCGGTLGALVNMNGVQHILSNYHVFEADIVSGGNSRLAVDGDYVIQPGLIDVGCNPNNAQNVGTLVVKRSLPGSNVDCSVAKVISGMVKTDGAILEIGTISSSTVAAYINQAVKKSGRTTGLTRSKISGLNATISVAYENECAGGAAFTKTFTGQIVISNLVKGKAFLAGGDSGSLMVEDIATNPRSVGLLFAGSQQYAIANPINEVLSFLGGATMVGN